MENNWEPRVGQRVVCLKSTKSFVKGNPYTVAEVIKCPRCKKIHITLSEVKSDLGDYDCGCGKDNIQQTIYYGGPSKFFAPISEQYADMTAEIAQQFKEHPDTVDQPVKVLETVN